MATSKPKTKADPKMSKPPSESSMGGVAPEGPPRGGAFLLDPVVQPIFTREQFSEEQKEI